MRVTSRVRESSNVEECGRSDRVRRCRWGEDERDSGGTHTMTYLEALAMGWISAGMSSRIWCPTAIS